MNSKQHKQHKQHTHTQKKRIERPHTKRITFSRGFTAGQGLLRVGINGVELWRMHLART